MATEVSKMSTPTRAVLKLLDARIAFWNEAFPVPTGAPSKDAELLHDKLSVARSQIGDAKYELDAIKKLKTALDAAVKRVNKLADLEHKMSKQATKYAIGNEGQTASDLHCEVCNKPADRVCCKFCAVPYCSAACKTAHWISGPKPHYKDCPSNRHRLPISYQNQSYTLK